MALLSVIRRWALREQLSIREIARRTGLSRNTIRKYLRSGAVEPKVRVPDRPSKLDAFADRLANWLKAEANPDELVWKHLKADTVGRMAVTGKEDLSKKVRRSMRELQNDARKIISFFQKPSLKYAA